MMAASTKKILILLALVALVTVSQIEEVECCRPASSSSSSSNNTELKRALLDKIKSETDTTKLKTLIEQYKRL